MGRPLRLRVFVDFWNLQLTLNERVAEQNGVPEARVKIDWVQLPNVLIREAARILAVTDFSYDGMIVFTSYNPKTEKKYHKWATNFLDRQPGIQVQCHERRPKRPPRCPVCHEPIKDCPKCGVRMAGTTEKGVDTAIATAMIRLAWEQAFDVAILVSSDADLVPAVKFLDLRGFRVIQAAFPPAGIDLSRACWGTIDIMSLRRNIERP